MKKIDPITIELIREGLHATQESTAAIYGRLDGMELDGEKLEFSETAVESGRFLTNLIFDMFIESILKWSDVREHYSEGIRDEVDLFVDTISVDETEEKEE